MPAPHLLLALGLVTMALYLARQVLMPIALAVLLAFLLNPLVRAVERVLPRALAVLVVVGLAFSVLGGAGWMMSSQVSSLAAELPKYRENIRQRIAELRGASRGGTIENLQSTARDVMQELDKDTEGRPAKAPPERVVVSPPPRAMLALPAALGPIAEALVQAGLVIALVGFLLLRRQELRNRLIRLVGERRLTVATKAIDDAGDRISRYLFALSAVNAAFGVAVGIGLFLIGLPYALLWAAAAAVLRFIPYVGTWTAALLPITLSLAVYEGWREPLLVVALFVILEPLIFLVVEPLVYSQRVGVSDVALLVAVAFWTWLWGATGLVLAVPLTVCLVVLGKHVPELRFMAILLGDEPDVEPALACYQRLLSGDQDEATEVAEAHLDPARPAAVYDDVLVPALAYARRERAWDRISDDDRALVTRGSRDIVADIAAPSTPPGPDARRIIACPVRDEIDELGVHMFRQLLDSAQWEIELASAEMLSSEVVALVAERPPHVICLASIGAGGLTQTRYLVKRLRAALPGAPIVVGRWGAPAVTAAERTALLDAGATEIAATLAETRDHVVGASTRPHAGTPREPVAAA
jgi:predicted PurR-regulated permease PerM